MSTPGSDSRFKFPLGRLFLVLLVYALAFGLLHHQGAVGYVVAAIAATVIAGLMLMAGQRDLRSYFGRVALLCLAGSFLLWWPFTDARSLSWYGRHLEIVDNQLHGLKDLLRDYKSTRGRYPTNDEGLAALENFESRFTLSYDRRLDEIHRNGSSRFYSMRWNRSSWHRMRWYLEGFRENHGRAPCDQEELLQQCMGMAYHDAPPGGEAEREPMTVEIAIDKHDNVFLLDRAGVLSPWLLPYNYENRNGVDAKAFRESPAGGDRWGCSVRVDDGVYLFASGGYLYAREYRRIWWQRNGPRLFGVVLILMGVTVAVSRVVRAKKGRPLLGILAVIPGFLLGGAWSAMSYATCYVMSEIFSRRSPEMVSFQMKLLDSYRERGVISEETYQRAVSATGGEKPAPDDKEENPPE